MQKTAKTKMVPDGALYTSTNVLSRQETRLKKNWFSTSDLCLRYPVSLRCHGKALVLCLLAQLSLILQLKHIIIYSLALIIHEVLMSKNLG